MENNKARKASSFMRVLCWLVVAFIAVLAIGVYKQFIAIDNTTVTIHELPAVTSFQMDIPNEWEIEYYECVQPAPGDYIAFASITVPNAIEVEQFTWTDVDERSAADISGSIHEMNQLLYDWGYTLIPEQYTNHNWIRMKMQKRRPDPKINRYCYLLLDTAMEQVFMIARD